MKVLFIRSSISAHFFAPIAGALRKAEGVDFLQYPAFPPHHRTYVRKLYDPEKAWKDLHVNVVSTRKEFERLIESGEIDLVLLADDGAELFRRFGSLKQRYKILIEWCAHILKGSRELADQILHYQTALPWPIGEFGERVPLVVIENSDASCLSHENRKLFEASRLYFKRELPYDRFFMYYPDRPVPWKVWRRKLLPECEKIHGISMGIEDEKYADLKRMRVSHQDIDVLISGVISNTARQEAEKRIRKLKETTDYEIRIADDMSFDEYCATVARSKVTVSVAGSRWECFRHFEAIALGSIPFMNRPTVDAVDWDPAPSSVFFENNFSNFDEQLLDLISNAQLRGEALQVLEKLVEKSMLSSKIVSRILHTSISALGVEDS